LLQLRRNKPLGSSVEAVKRFEISEEAEGSRSEPVLLDELPQSSVIRDFTQHPDALMPNSSQGM